MTDRSADEAAILGVILKMRKAVAERDFESLAECFVDAPYTTRWNASRISGTFVLQGWDEIAARSSDTMRDPSDVPPSDPATIEILNIRVDHDMAWLTFARRYPGIPQHRTSPDAAFHLRIFERQNGVWKIVFLGFLDPGIGRPDAAIIRLDDRGTVIWMNPLASAVMEAEDDLVIRGGRLRIRDSRVNQKLQDAIRWAAALGRGVVPRRGAVPIVMDTGEGLATKVWWIVCESGAILFFLGGPDFEAQRLDTAAVVYGLSPAQRRVAGHVVAGLSLTEIAETMKIKPTTARTHLDRMFEKTGVRNRSALVRVLLSSAAPL